MGCVQLSPAPRVGWSRRSAPIEVALAMKTFAHYVDRRALETPQVA